jgi:surfeit locus 1 family protein
LAGLLLWLGGWQLDRAEHKRVLLEARDAALTAPPVGLDALRGDWEALRFRRVEVHGRYLSDRPVLLDNRIHRGRAGYHAFTAFSVDGLQPLLLVNRGWVPLGPDRGELPEVSNLPGERKISGILDTYPRPGIRLAPEVVVREGWPLLVLELVAEQLAAAFGRPVLPLMLKLDPQAGDSYDREWVWSEGFGPERHLSYAFQWYALALALGVIFVVVNLRSSRKKDFG